MGDLNINIASYLLGRVDDSENAYSVIKLDASIPSKVLNDLENWRNSQVWQVKIEKKKSQNFYLKLIYLKIENS